MLSGYVVDVRLRRPDGTIQLCAIELQAEDEAAASAQATEYVASKYRDVQVEPVGQPRPYKRAPRLPFMTGPLTTVL